MSRMSRKTLGVVMVSSDLALIAASLGTGRPTWVTVALGVLLVPVVVWTVLEFREARRGPSEG